MEALLVAVMLLLSSNLVASRELRSFSNISFISFVFVFF
uniref:Uncharacterized protein n=1 Tax=Arundo donax TaxID=35708 RepID=A0A0A9ESB6_ARUDO